MKKITVKDEDGEFHTYRGDEYRFQEKDEICRILKTGKTEEGEFTQKTISTFRNYKFVKESSDERTADAAPSGPAPGPDRYTQAALASRTAAPPDFTMLDKSRPIESVTEQKPDLPDAVETITPAPLRYLDTDKIDFSRPEIVAKNMMNLGPDPATSLGVEMAATEIIAPDPAALARAVENFGLKKASSLTPRPKPPADISYHAGNADAGDIQLTLARIKKKYDEDGAETMTDEDYGIWMGNLPPADIAALMLQHQTEMKSGRVRMDEPPKTDDRLPPPKPARGKTKAKKSRGDAIKEDIAAYEAEGAKMAKELEARPQRPPAEPEADTAEETVLASAYETIAQAEQRHKKRRVIKCQVCRDTGVVPNPDDPEDMVACRSC